MELGVFESSCCYLPVTVLLLPEAFYSNETCAFYLLLVSDDILVTKVLSVLSLFCFLLPTKVLPDASCVLLIKLKRFVELKLL